MIDPREFRAPYIPIEDIRRAVEEFRKSHWPQNKIPVDILEIAEFELNIEIRAIPNLREAGDVDALLLGDLNTIVVDQNDFLNDSSQNRLRFSFAHEIGHKILHSDMFSKIQYSSLDEWISFFRDIPDDQYTWIEQHAYEFAGRLLVPKEQLIEKLREAVVLAKDSGFDDWDSSGDSTRQFVAHGISRHFEVSDQVIEKRLLREGLWPPVAD